MPKKTDIDKPTFRKKRVPVKKSVVGSVQKKKIQEELTSIYENTDGTLPDMTTFEKKQRGGFFRSVIFLLISLLVLGGALYAGLFYFDSGSTFSKQDVLLSVKGEEVVMNGDHVTYRISYRNAQKLPIAQARLQVRYPEGFVFESASISPQNEANNEWTLGTLARNESGYIDIEGKLFGNSGDNQSIRVFFTYLPSNFSSEFQSVETFVTRIDEGIFAITVEGAETVVAGVDSPFVIRLKPKDVDTVFRDVALDLSGSGVTVVSSTSAVNVSETKRINVPEFSNEIAIPVSLRFSQTGSTTLSVVLYQSGKTGQEDVVLSQFEKIVSIQNTDVSVQFVVNGTSANTHIRPGETLSNSIRIKNVGVQPVDNVVVTLSFDTPSFQNTSMLKWSSIVDPADGTIIGEQKSPEVRRGSIVWTKTQIPLLARLEPNKEVTIDVSLPLKNSQDTNITSFPDGPIMIVPVVSFTQQATNKTVATEPIELTVQSDTTLSVRHSVLNNVHTVTWLINNSFHEINAISLEADVFGDIVWQSDKIQKSAGTVTYDEKNKKVRWEIPTMPPSVDVNSLSFSFALNSNNPTQTNLTSKVKMSARDTVVNQDMVLVGDEVRLR